MLIAIGRDRKVDLFCECSAPVDGAIEGMVINGEWSFTLKDGVLTCHHTKESRPVEIVWQGRLPSDINRYDYEAAIEWVNNELLCFGSVQWFRQRWYALRVAVHSRASRFFRACGAAKRAYKVVYAANSRFVKDEDDLIPF
jgi:hypothetical protein